jgi:hypothetical protein
MRYRIVLCPYIYRNTNISGFADKCTYSVEIRGKTKSDAISNFFTENPKTKEIIYTVEEIKKYQKYIN